VERNRFQKSWVTANFSTVNDATRQIERILDLRPII
jgi:hypothetical protein